MTQADLSRLGRNYIEVGNYTEILFPRWNVRYIAINNNFDSLYNEGNELAPFKNLFNEWYARDTSKKIRAVIKAKTERGERVGTTIPYGYKRNPVKNGPLLRNDYTTSIVKRIFELCAGGKGPSQIARILREEKIVKPTVYRYQTEGVIATRTDITDLYSWSCETVSNILSNEIYLGHTINCRTTTASFKDKRTIERPLNEQYRFENTHEALIDQDTWNIVQEVRKGKRRRTAMGDINKYSGLLFCADCGNKLYFVHGRTMEKKNFNYICSRNRKHLGEDVCSPHTIRECVLDEIVLDQIRSATYAARKNTKVFAELIQQKSTADNRKELQAKSKELAKAEKRNCELNALFKRIYEDNVLGKVTNEQFHMLSDTYNDEQREIQERIPQLQAQIEHLKSAQVNTERFIALAGKYTDITELTPEILRAFISKIVIHEREQKWSKGGNQQIDIYFNHIGNIAA